MIPVVVSCTGFALLLIKPLDTSFRRRRYDRDTADGIGAALHQSFAPPATDRDLLELLKKVP
jgi:hypothetical protein